MKDYEYNKELSNLQYWDINTLYSWPMLEKFPVSNFEWIEKTSHFNEGLKKNYNEESDEGYFLEVGVQYLGQLHKLRNDLPFLPERMNIEKLEMLVADLHDKSEHFIHLKNLKQALNSGLVLKKVDRVIKFNQNAWLKPYIDLNTDLRKKANNFEKYFFRLMNNGDFGKTMESVRKNRHIKLVTTDRGRNYLVSEPNYHTAKFFLEYLLAIEMKKNAYNYE